MESWTHVILPRTNLYGFTTKPSFGNAVHYVEVCDWCNNTLKQSDLYRCKIDKATGVKHFWFKNPAHATMFSLRWS